MAKAIFVIVMLSIATIASCHTCQSEPEECPCTTPEQNRQFALNYFETIVNQQDFTKFENFIGKGYVHHNPWIKEDKDSLLQGLKQFLSGNPKGEAVKVYHSIAYDDMAWVHSKMTLNGKENVHVGLFRFKCGKFVEHWDAIQEIVPNTVNEHPYF